GAGPRTMRDGTPETLVVGFDPLDSHDQNLAVRVLQFAVAEGADVERLIGGQEQHRLGGFGFGEKLSFPPLPGTQMLNVDENIGCLPALRVDQPLPDREAIALLFALV